MEKPDHESNFDTGDSAMTIEFLRARLVSERSVSKSAKQRADELADRVVDLEKQLKVVSLQRKKAEKATSDVLAILETLGFSDSSDGCDSSSDQDFTHPQSSNGNCSIKNADKSRSIDQEELESPTFYCRSLSWKSSNCSLQCERKLGSASSRRRSNFLSTDSSSPKHRLGKSCRQIKRKEMRSTVAELSRNEAISDSQIADDDSKLSRCNHENQDQDPSAGDTESVCIRSPRKLIDSEHHFHKHEGAKQMERALEHQAELICRYEAEENAQIEWEEKFKENNSSTQESVEPGSNQSDVTEERDELKRQPAYFCPPNEHANSEVKDARVANDVCRILSNDVQPSPQTTVGSEKYQNADPQVYSQTSHPEIGVPIYKTNQIQEKPEGCSYHPPSPVIHQSSVSNYSSSNQATANDKYHESESYNTEPGKGISVSREPSEELGRVLEALQQAKLSLQHKLRKLPLSEDRFMGKTVEPCQVSAMSSAARAQIPVTYAAALCKVPTNLQPKANVYKHNLDSRSQSSRMNYYHESTSTVPVNVQLKLNPQEGEIRLNVSEGSTFDFDPNWKTTLSSLGCGDEYARSRSVHSNRGFSSNDPCKLDPQNGTPRSTFIDGHEQIPYHDSQFTFLPNDLYRSSSQPENNRSSFYGADPHIQGAYVNRLSSSSSDRRRQFKPQGETTRPSLIDNGQFVRNPYNGSSLSMSSPSHILSTTSSGAPQPISPESYYSREPDISLSSHARHSYRPDAHPSLPDFNPPMPTFSGFPLFPPTPGFADNHRPGMYRI